MKRTGMLLATSLVSYYINLYTISIIKNLKLEKKISIFD